MQTEISDYSLLFSLTARATPDLSSPPLVFRPEFGPKSPTQRQNEYFGTKKKVLSGSISLSTSRFPTFLFLKRLFGC